MTTILQTVGVLGMAFVGVALVVGFAALIADMVATIREEFHR